MAFSPAAAALRTSHYLNVVARLAPGVSLAAARDDMRRVDEVQRQEYPEPGRHATSVLVPIDEELLGDTRMQLLLLMAAAAAVLLIACANLASLLLSAPPAAATSSRSAPRSVRRVAVSCARW